MPKIDVNVSVASAVRNLYKGEVDWELPDEYRHQCYHHAGSLAFDRYTDEGDDDSLIVIYDSNGSIAKANINPETSCQYVIDLICLTSSAEIAAEELEKKFPVHRGSQYTVEYRLKYVEAVGPLDAARIWLGHLRDTRKTYFVANVTDEITGEKFMVYPNKDYDNVTKV